VALGDYAKTTYVNGSAPGISATRLNNNENKTAELDTALTTHQADYTLQVPYAGITTGTANTYAIATPITALTTGMAVSVKFNLDSTGVSTLNWNGKGAKGIKKSTGANVTNLKAIGIYTMRYDGTNFILQGEGASGNAIASDLLLGKTASTDAGDITGTIPNKTAQTYTPGTIVQTITSGQFLVETQIISGDDDLIAPNILSGVNIFGVAGSVVAGKQWATGSASVTPNATLTVTGLSFQPSCVVMYTTSSTSGTLFYRRSIVAGLSGDMALLNGAEYKYGSGSYIMGAHNLAYSFNPTGFTATCNNEGYTNTWQWLAYE
jgi:hypothetical protein